MTALLTFAGVTSQVAGTLETDANLGSLRLYAGPPMTSTTVVSAVNPLLATATLGSPAFTAGVANITGVVVSRSGIPTTGLLCKNDGTPLALFSVGGRGGYGDLVIDDDTVDGATRTTALLTEGQSLVIDFRLLVGGGGSGGGVFDKSVRGAGSVLDPRGFDPDYVAGYLVPVLSYVAGDLLWAKRAVSSGLDGDGDPIYPAYLVDPTTLGLGATMDVKVKTGAYTMLSGDQTVIATGAGGWTLVLPTAVGRTTPVYFKNAGTGVVTLDGNGSQTIEGATTIAVPANNAVMLVSDNANWSVL